MTNTPIFQRLKKGYAFLTGIEDSLRSPFLLIIRLYWGYSFMMTGYGKLTHLDRTTAFFTELGIPMPGLNAIMAGTTECVGGLLLLLGLGSRLVTIPLVFTMCVAYATAERDALKGIFSNPDGFLKADPFLFMLACLIVMIFGPGLFSLDALLGRKLNQGSQKDAK